MAKIVLQPSGDPASHYADTIEAPVPLPRILEALTPEQTRALAPAFEGRQGIATWGAVPGVNAGKWERMAPGDITLFANDGRVFAVATVVDKVQSPELALDLWGRDEKGRTWEYIYFLDELRNVNIPYAELAAAAGYEPNFVVLGFNVLSEDKSAEIISAFDLASDRQSPDLSEKDFEKAIDGKLSDAESLDRYGLTPQRVEQQFLRRSLFKRHQRATCCLCGRLLPVDLLCASHIKRRARCSREERLDYKNIVAPMCLAGCDALYERGYVAVDGQGRVVGGRIDVYSDDLKAALQNIIGRQCSAWNSSSERYFRWHLTEVYGRAEQRSKRQASDQRRAPSSFNKNS